MEDAEQNTPYPSPISIRVSVLSLFSLLSRSIRRAIAGRPNRQPLERFDLLALPKLGALDGSMQGLELSLALY